MLGGEVVKISILAKGEGWALTANDYPWQNIAVWLAPALLDNLSPGDERWLKRQNPYRRGYAWGWLQKNRRRILKQAKQIEAKMGRTTGTLTWDPEMERWQWKKRKPRNQKKK